MMLLCCLERQLLPVKNELYKMQIRTKHEYCTKYNALYPMNLDEIGQVIRQARKNSQLSQATLAKQLGMSRATLSGIENGTVPEVGIRKILSICAALGTELIAQPKTKRPTLQQLMKEQNDA